MPLCASNVNPTVAYAFHSPKGKFTLMKQIEHRGSFATLLSINCNVKIEPQIQALQGENFALKSMTTDNDDARLESNVSGVLAIPVQKKILCKISEPASKKLT